MLKQSLLQLLLEHQDAIAPDPNDVLNELLTGLGEVPDVETFLGKLQNQKKFLNIVGLISSKVLKK